MATIVQQTNGEKTIYTADEYTQVQQKFNDIYNTQLPGKANQTDMNTVNAQLEDIVTLSPSGTDDTSNIQSLLDSGKVVRLRPTAYKVSKLTLNSNARIITGGFNTQLNQLSGQTTNTPIITIQGSNVEIDSMQYTGNISTDTGEWNHAVYINPVAGSGIIENITIGNIYAKDIRGDALTIGGTLNDHPVNVKVGNVYSSNTYRQGVSIIAGKNIEIDNVYAMNSGVLGVDIEPNSAKIDNVKIGNVITSSIQISGLYNQPSEHIKFGNVILIRSNGGSAPNYNYNGQDAVIFRNTRHVDFDSLYVTGFDRFSLTATVSGSDINPDDINIKHFIADNCSLTDTTYSSYVGMSGFKRLKIGGGNLTLQDASKTGFKGSDQNDTTLAELFIENFVSSGGSLAGYCRVFANFVETNSGSFYHLKPNSRISNSVINTTNVLGYSTNVTFDNCEITYTGYLFDSGNPKNSLLNCTLNGAKTFVSYSSAMPTAGSWNAGDTVMTTGYTQKGTVGSQYILLGWKRITTGSNNVLNTDWVEMRVLTGN